MANFPGTGAGTFICPSEFLRAHHHSLQHKQVVELLKGDGGSPNASQKWSGLLEMSVSRGAIERKRRLEMKDLFDRCWSPSTSFRNHLGFFSSCSKNEEGSESCVWSQQSFSIFHFSTTSNLHAWLIQRP
ncbi:hypothetical protein DL98DRAFT_228656 [Cadophora sp. DSE1049]|nr:hypothetical protein DL98DRAFT_228656 [Cadophora sp. DSE1049]